MNADLISATLAALSTMVAPPKQNMIALDLTIQHAITKLYKQHNPLADPRIFTAPAAALLH